MCYDRPLKDNERRDTMPTKEPTHPGGKCLRAFRTARGLKQKALGKLIGYKKDDEIRGYEYGSRKMLVDDLKKIELALGLTPAGKRELRAAFGLENLIDFEVLQGEYPIL